MDGADSKKDWTEPPPDWVETRYEQKALEQGHQTGLSALYNAARAGHDMPPPHLLKTLKGLLRKTLKTIEINKAGVYIPRALIIKRTR